MKNIFSPFIPLLLLISCLILPTESAESQETTNLKALRAIYDKGYAPPGWTVGFSKNKALYEECCKSVVIYTTQGVKRKEIIQLYTHRDPVNIALRTHHDKKAMQETFGIEKPYYITYYNTNQALAPQTVVCCKTPVFFPQTYTVDNSSASKAYDDENFEAPGVIYAHFINAIGAAFDNKKQPDYQYFISPDDTITQEKKKELCNFYINIANMIFQYLCDEKKFERLVFTKYGCNFFAEYYPGGRAKFFQDIFVPVFKYSLAKYAVDLKQAGVKEIAFTGDEIPPELAPFIEAQGFSTAAYGLLPHTFCRSSGKATKLANSDELQKTAFLNAFDPNSFGGNGNRKDSKSLDGSIGAASAIAPLMWTKTNTHLTVDAIRYIPSSQGASLLSNDTNDDALDTTDDTSSDNRGFYLSLVYSIVSIVLIFYTYSHKKKTKESQQTRTRRS